MQVIRRPCLPFALPDMLANTILVSTTLLLFPSDGWTFETLQIQGISMYMMRYVILVRRAAQGIELL